MGIFSGLKKAVKSVFKGILKVFSPILKPLGKLLDSKFGKALMVGLSIFTLGTAMVAGQAAFASSSATSFVGKFVEGGKAFLSTMTGVGGKESASGIAETTNAANDVSQINTLAGGAPNLTAQSGLAGGGSLSEAAGASGSMAFGPATNLDQPMKAVTAGGQGAAGQGAMLPEVPGAAAKAAELAAKVPEGIPGGGKGWLEKAKDAGKGFMDFASSEGGGQVVGSLIQGAGNYYTEKDRQEFEDRVRRDWASGDSSSGVRNVRDQSARVGSLEAPSAQNVARSSRSTAKEGSGRPYFQRAYGAGS